MAARGNRPSRGSERLPGRYGGRRVGIRATRPVIEIVCDDARTAPAYFEELRRWVKDRVTLKIVPNRQHNSATNVLIELAREKLDALLDDAEEDRRDAAWVLLDLEQDRDREQSIQEARHSLKSAASQRNVFITASQPCFELWTLLHFEDIGKGFENCKAVVKRLSYVWEQQLRQKFPDRKSDADYSKIVGNRGLAAKRARGQKEAGAPSWTEIFLLIESLESLDGFIPEGGGT